MTLNEWKLKTALVQWIHNVQKQPEWATLMEVLNEEHPKNAAWVGQPSAEIALGEIWGFDKCVNLLKSAAIPPMQVSTPLVPTFEPPEPE